MHRLLRILLFPLLALGLLAAPGPANASVRSSHQSKEAAAAAIARGVIKDLSIGQHATDQRTGTARQVSGLTQVQSTNWSGYVDTGSGFTEANGAWKEPSVTCSGTATSFAAFWVGIDGYSSESVEQDGTLIECYDRTAYQYTWWEMYPANDIQLVGSTVKSGDSIYAVVSRSGDAYTLTVDDYTHPASDFTTTQTCSDCANSSAEWIAEAPSGPSGPYPLADFGSWTVTSCSVAENGVNGVISSFPDSEVTMVDSSGTVKARPSALGSNGCTFTVTWDRST